MFQTASQPSRAVHFQQPQYLHQTHQTSLQYRHPVSEQPSCQQIVSTTHTSSYTLPTCPAGFQTSVQGLGHVPTGVGMSLAIPVEVKPCLNVSYNRSYQINEHYPCITQCFERWFYVKVRPDPDCLWLEALGQAFCKTSLQKERDPNFIRALQIPAPGRLTIPSNTPWISGRTKVTLQTL